MTTHVTEQMALRDAKNTLSAVVERVHAHHDRVVITRHGQPAVVVLSVEDLESIEETLDILSDPEEAAALREAIAEADRGEVVRLTKDEALARWGKRAD